MNRLYPELVRELRRLSKKGWSTRELASRFGLGVMTVSDMLTGKTWAHVTDELTVPEKALSELAESSSACSTG